MRKGPLLAMAIAAVSALAAPAVHADARLLHAMSGAGSVFHVAPEAAARHSVRMARARQLYMMRRTPSPALQLDWIDRVPLHLPFFWAADDGSTLHRPAEGLFHVSIFDPEANWERHFDCIDAGWPDYYCTDGTTRQMSAPDLNNVDFADRNFSRQMPMVPPLAPAGEAASGEP